MLVYEVVSAMIEGCDVPAARFEWMLTDMCGNSSTGYLDDVPVMQALYPMLKLIQSPSIYFGNVYSYSSSGNWMCWNTQPTTAVNVDFSKGFSSFAYFNAFDTSGLNTFRF